MTRRTLRGMRTRPSNTESRWLPLSIAINDQSCLRLLWREELLNEAQRLVVERDLRGSGVLGRENRDWRWVQL